MPSGPGCLPWKTHAGALVTTSGNNTSQHVRAAEQLGGKLNMSLAKLLANTGGADRLSIDAQQLVTIDVNVALGSPILSSRQRPRHRRGPA